MVYYYRSRPVNDYPTSRTTWNDGFLWGQEEILQDWYWNTYNYDLNRSMVSPKIYISSGLFRCGISKTLHVRETRRTSLSRCLHSCIYCRSTKSCSNFRMLWQACPYKNHGMDHYIWTLGILHVLILLSIRNKAATSKTLLVHCHYIREWTQNQHSKWFIDRIIFWIKIRRLGILQSKL